MTTLLCGDALAQLRTLPDACVHCCVTSPPYYGLRDYGVSGQIGLEPTPDEYITRLVAVFREVRRVLRDDGTLWVNLGDSYAGGSGKQTAGSSTKSTLTTSSRKGAWAPGSTICTFERPRITGDSLKPKDLIGIPWMLAFALRADGWWLRQDIIWQKVNPMPESVKDRCTKSHEYIFMLSKSARYHYDAAAVAEEAKPESIARYGRGRSEEHKWADGGPGNQTIAKGFDHMRKQDGHGRRHAGFNEREFAKDPRETRNRRSVWTIATHPTPEAHFATYPIDLPETCILAGCPEGGTVLDPFNGAGTTGLAAIKTGRNYIGIELNAEYLTITRNRFQKYYPLLAVEDIA